VTVPNKTFYDARSQTDLDVLTKVARMDTAASILNSPDKDMEAVAFFSPTVGGATAKTIDSREEIFTFAGDDSLYNTWLLPANLTQVDSAWIWVSTDSTLGDSVGFRLGHRGIAFEGAYDGNIISFQSGLVDLQTVVRLYHKIRFTTAFASVAADDVLHLLLERDESISNDQAGSVNFHRIRLFWQD